MSQQGHRYIGIKVIAFTLCVMLIICYMIHHTASAYGEGELLKDRVTVIIDPGHGGIDGGASTAAGVLESNINLQIGQKLNDLLQLLGVRTLMTRTADISLHTEGERIAQKKVSDLKNRVRLVNSTANVILVSIHQNYYPVPKYSGAQVFYAKTADSKELATQLQNALKENLDKSNMRKSKAATSVYLMDKVNCIGVLVECGFLSNPDEAQLLCDDSYQNKISCVIASSLDIYLQASAST